jgi:peptidoglycan L-alanyl-D-glutamate endopeptidase CwlK
MSDTISMIAEIQGEVGVKRDGKIGPVTIAAVLAALKARHMDPSVEVMPAATTSALFTFDARSEAVLATLDPKAVQRFREFLALAKGTAASLGCDYVLISGNRTYAQQDALYAKGRTAPGEVVTKARGGYSNHNFEIAVDAGVFLGKIYLDNGTAEQQVRASKVHRACSEHALSCGLAWGGNWKSIVDQPHYEIATTLTMAEKRKRYSEKGSVL